MLTTLSLIQPIKVELLIHIWFNALRLKATTRYGDGNNGR